MPGFQVHAVQYSTLGAKLALHGHNLQLFGHNLQFVFSYGSDTMCQVLCELYILLFGGVNLYG